MNADIITRVNFQDFYESHVREAAALTAGIRAYEYVVPYGVVEMEDEEISSIEERPKLSFNISCGIYVLSPSILDLVPDNQFLDMPDLIRLAVRNGHRTFVYQIREKWLAIESLGDLVEQTSRD